MSEETLRRAKRDDSSLDSNSYSNEDNPEDYENYDETLYAPIEYKKDNILLKSILWIVGGSFGIILILAVIGFIMGLSDVKPAFFDKDIFQSKISELQGNPIDSIGYNELDKND